MTARHRSPARAFTLVEMLIAMALTLIMVYAIAEFYAYVGDTVKDARAMIEVNSQVRSVVQRLTTDLDLVTVRPVVPWVNDDGAPGYIMVYEGQAVFPFSPQARVPATDADTNGNFWLDVDEDRDGDGVNDMVQSNATTLLGDGDDVLAMTIRAGNEPLTGRYYDTLTGQPRTIAAQHAEVIWWTGFDDLAPAGGGNPNGQWDWTEPRQIYRRQLLIRPDLGQINLRGPTTSGDYTTAASGGDEWQLALRDLADFWQLNDISASIRLEYNAAGEYVYRIRANSLADLSRREYRFGHLPQHINASGQEMNFPYPLVLLPSPSAVTPGVTSYTSFALQNTAVLQPPLRTLSISQGEDIMLSNVLAFDVRVYDPHAVLYSDGSSVYSPGDPGYLHMVTPGGGANVGTGAYVDLGYGRILERMRARLGLATSAVAFGNSHFWDWPAVSSTRLNAASQDAYRNRLAVTYDTWTWWYERDGRDQDFDGVIDSGTNGLDDDNANGVDDALEREANPPYARPLRGLEVKIRVYEPGTRQVRQATVGADFVAE